MVHAFVLMGAKEDVPQALLGWAGRLAVLVFFCLSGIRDRNDNSTWVRPRRGVCVARLRDPAMCSILSAILCRRPGICGTRHALTRPRSVHLRGMAARPDVHLSSRRYLANHQHRDLVATARSHSLRCGRLCGSLPNRNHAPAADSMRRLRLPCFVVLFLFFRIGATAAALFGFGALAALLVTGCGRRSPPGSHA